MAKRPHKRKHKSDAARKKGAEKPPMMEKSGNEAPMGNPRIEEQ